MKPFPPFPAYASILWGAFFWAGCPPPNVDEPFFIGAAVNWAQTGHLANPEIREWLGALHFQTDRYFVHFPFWPLLIGLWFRCWGIHVVSLTILYALFGLATSLGARIFFLKAGNLSRLAWLFPWPLLLLANGAGFRPDLVGLCLVFPGLVLLTHPSFASRSSGYALLGFSACFWPILCCFGGPFALFVFLTRPRPASALLSAGVRDLAAAALGALAVLAALGIAVQGELFLFLHDFSQHASIRYQSGIWNKVGELHQVFANCFGASGLGSFVFGVLLFAGLFLSGVSLFLPHSNRQNKLVFLTTISSFVLTAFIYPGTALFIVFLALLGICVALDSLLEGKVFSPGKVRFGLAWGLGLGVLWLLPKHRQSDEEKNQWKFQPAPRAKRLVYDEFAYRYTFQFQPPASAIPWLTVNLSPKLGALPDEKKPGDYWLVRSDKLGLPGRDRADLGQSATAPPPGE